MDFSLHKTKNRVIAELKTHEELNTYDDFLDLIGNASYQDAYEILIHKNQINTDFFNLKSGFAGEVLQKFSTYGMRLAIVGDFSDIKSKSMNDFIRESNKVGRINFIANKALFLGVTSAI